MRDVVLQGEAINEKVILISTIDSLDVDCREDGDFGTVGYAYTWNNKFKWDYDNVDNWSHESFYQLKNHWQWKIVLWCEEINKNRNTRVLFLASYYLQSELSMTRELNRHFVFPSGITLSLFSDADSYYYSYLFIHILIGCGL